MSNSYWNILTDKKLLLKALQTQKDLYKADMENLTTQSSVYQNYYDSKLDNVLNSKEFIGKDRSAFQRRFAYNVIGVAIDHLLSRVSRLKPKPSFISNSYLYSMKSKIKTLDIKTLSNMKEQGLYEKADTALKNAYIQNMGILKSFPGDDKVLYFPVEVSDFFIHKPYIGQQMKMVAGDRTRKSIYTIYRDIYPKMEKELQKDFIEKYKLEDIASKLNDGTFEDKEVEVYDFYYISKKNSKRVVWTEKCLLVQEKWDYDFLPYDYAYYHPPQRGIVGVGVSEILSPMQQRLNTLLKKISKSLDISFYPIILAHIGTIVQRKFTDEAAQVVTWEGATPPTQLVQAITHPQAFEHLYHIINMMYRSVRLDEQVVASSTPEGQGKASGVAIKNLETAETAKVYQPAKAFENFIVSIAKKTARYIVKENYDGISEVIQDDKEFFKNINTWPVSLFPSTPEGKFQRAEFLIQAGLMTPEEIADLYDFPELAGSVLAQKGSKISATYAMLEKSISDNSVVVPDPILGYENQLKVAEGLYGKLQLEEEKYKNQIKNLRKFIGLCSDAIKKEQQEILRQQMEIQQSLNPQVPPGGGAISQPAA